MRKLLLRVFHNRKNSAVSPHPKAAATTSTSTSRRICPPHHHHHITTTTTTTTTAQEITGNLLYVSPLLRLLARRPKLPFSSLGQPVISRAPHFPVSLLRRTLADRGGLLWSKFSLQKRAFGPSSPFGAQRRFWTSWIPTSDDVVYGLIGVNVAVYVLWRTVDFTFMRQNFTISMENVKSGRLHTLITGAFSHMDADHILANMIGLYFFGTSIGRLFGPEFLLKLYIAGAISGSIFFLVHNALIVPSLEGMGMSDHRKNFALGASAAVNAIMLLNVFLFPKRIYYVNFFIPVPAALMGAILIGSDLWRMKKGDERVSGAGHLGGAVVAFLVFGIIKSRGI